MKKRIKVLVLAGGLSEERAVSLASAKAITEALQRLGHETLVIDSASGQSLLDPSGHYRLLRDESSNSKIALVDRKSDALSSTLSQSEFRDVDLVFLALHGGAGEDGTIQALLEMAGRNYTGSAVLASAVAMNKAFAKRILSKENIPTPPWRLLKITDIAVIPAFSKSIMKEFSLPIIIKPNNSGSTVGLTLVKELSSLPSALEQASKVSKEVLVEKYVKGREITASVLNGRPLPLVEILPTNELYDYQCKYTKGKSNYVCPAEISEEVTREIQRLAARAYEIIDCAGLARADFILDADNRPFFLEINTLPGMTELSLAPMAAREAGLNFDQLVDEICRTALGN
ncbi:D-alanine--D-alanine ligase A [Candidatus Zixiibacteriota bacterium]|nr:D-alanine--D-alanine ligase A [candidate division Zixibacteria bacterium]